MKQGDYSELAEHYVHRPGYSDRVLRMLASLVATRPQGTAAFGELRVADVGAGTGKLTEHLIDMGLSGYAVEPNAAMGEQWVKVCGTSRSFQLVQAGAEATTLPSVSIDWVLMASSFHWTDAPRALAEFHRILKPGGFFTALWNPRELEGNDLQRRIEELITTSIPELKRVSSGTSEFTKHLPALFASTPYFHDLVFVEAPHEVIMNHERYLGVWRSVNDVQAQAGPERFQEIMDHVAAIIAPLGSITVSYKTRSWTVQRRD